MKTIRTILMNVCGLLIGFGTFNAIKNGDFDVVIIGISVAILYLIMAIDYENKK